MERRQRVELDDSMSMMLVLTLMAEGDPDAGNVIGHLLQDFGPAQAGLYLFTLNDMNIRGTQIWTAFKKHCNESTRDFMLSIVKHDPAMIAAVNQANEGSSYYHRAVVGGASKPGARNFLTTLKA